MNVPASVGVLLVPGAWHGGWWYEPLAVDLERHGLAALPITLSGLGVGDDGTRAVTLDEHVDEVHAAIASMRDAAERVVVVGHSYAGSVITAAADRDPGHVDALVYLDAFVPESGDSCFSMANDEVRQWYLDGAGRTGHGVDPLPFFDPRARPHPLASLVQKSQLRGAWRAVPERHYVAATGWPGELPLSATTERVRSESGWVVHEWDTPHNVMRDGHTQLLDLLLDIAGALDDSEPEGEPQTDSRPGKPVP